MQSSLTLVIERLEAWADNEWDLGLRSVDSKAETHYNRANNYRNLIRLLQLDLCEHSATCSNCQSADARAFMTAAGFYS